MHGKKIAVNSGILEIANNKDALAALMGHEIAHSVERHNSERENQGMLLELSNIAVEKILFGNHFSEISDNYTDTLLHM